MISANLKCKKDSIIKECPICKANLKKETEQPNSGTHVSTLIYNCGTEIDYPIGYDGALYGVSCDGTFKRFTMPKYVKLHQEERL